MSVKGQGSVIAAAGQVRIAGTQETKGQASVTPTAVNAGLPTALPSQAAVPVLPEGTSTCTTQGTPTCTAPGTPPTVQQDGTVLFADGSYRQVTLTGSARISIGPGRYGELDITNSNVTMRPGTYVIGKLTVSGPSTITGDGTNVYLSCGTTCQNATLSLTSSASIQLNATNPAAASSLVLDDRTVNTLSMTGSSSIIVSGPIDALSTAAELAGTASITTKRLTLAQATLQGSAKLTTG